MDSNIGETPGVSDVSGLEGNKFLTSEYLYCSNTLGTESSVELPRIKVFSDNENFKKSGWKMLIARENDSERSNSLTERLIYVLEYVMFHFYEWEGWSLSSLWTESISGNLYQHDCAKSVSCLQKTSKSMLSYIQARIIIINSKLWFHWLLITKTLDTCQFPYSL